MRTLPILRNVCCALLWALTMAQVYALDPHKDVRQYNYQAWQTDNGLPQNTVHAVLQTHDGYIWFATESGLVRFDGEQFAVFDKQNTPGLGSDLIYSLYEDRAGTLWIGASGGLTQFKNGAFHTFTIRDGLPGNTVWSIYQDRAGTLWAVTADGLASYTGGKFHAIPVPQGLSATSRIIGAQDGSLWVGTNSGLLHIVHGHETKVDAGAEIQALAIDKQGRVWVATQAGLMVLKPGGFDNFKLSANDITALLSDSAGRMWIGTANGLFLRGGPSVRQFTVKNGLPSAQINGLYEDREHSLWVSTNRGLARIVNGQVESFTSRDGLSSNLILSMFEDREGDLWLGTESGGLGVLRNRKFTTYTAQDGLSDDLLLSVYQDHKGTVWIGTNGGGLDRWSGHDFSALTTSDGLSSNIVLALADDAAGDLWVGTPDGLDRMRDGQVKVFTSADGLADDFVRSLYTDSRGTLWIGTRRGLTRYANGAFTSYTRMDGLGSDLVGTVIEDRDGSFWISTLDGLTHFSGGRFENYTTANGLSSNVITALNQDAAGTLWIGTKGGGLDSIKGGKFTRYPSSSGELPQNIYSILEDRSGHLWLGSDRGIYRVSSRQLKAFASGAAHGITAQAYGTADGMKISECSSGGHPAAWELRDGTLWFATLRGASVIDPQHMAINHVPPPVAIEQVSVDDQPFSAAQLKNVAPGRSRFAFQYAGLSFVAPQKVRYKYKLDGFDRNWVDAGARRTAYYTNVPPGRYTFRVIACNNDGVWNDAGASVSFQLKPHFYRTYWFDLALLLAIIFLGYEAYRRRVRRVEQQLEAQYSAVMAERNRIAREIHDTLAQGFVAVSVQLEIVSRLLASSTESAKSHLEQARTLVRSSLTEARSSIWELRSQSSEREDLATRLTRTLEQATATTEIKTRVQVHGTYRPLARNVENELLRIAQEAFVNVVRHAGATRIEFELRFEEKRLRMTIQDDGCGFSGQASSHGPGGHFGLTGMQERAESIGGSCTVKSVPGRGTEVAVEIGIE